MTFTAALMCAAALISRAGTPAGATVEIPSGDRFPNGEPIPEWFSDTTRVDVAALGERYVVTEHGVLRDSALVQTGAIQRVIDLAAGRDGGVVVIPRGTFLSGSLFFRPGTHLLLEEGAVLRGIDDIRHYPVVRTRLEGRTIDYFAALVNADGLDGFTITGPGTIDGNGRRFWEEFWLRRRINPECTNLEAMRPRLVYISNCSNVCVQNVRLVNSPFWTNHLYRCDHVRYLGCDIFAPTAEPSPDGVYGPDDAVPAPSSDAIDIDCCHDVLVSGCRMSVNDDAVVLKGGKGTFADTDPDNGPNHNIVVQHCTYGRVFGCLTLGSESIHDWNVVLRDITFENADRVLWLKMRPDTPQVYEGISVENVHGTCGSFLVVRPWTQFYELLPREDMPLSVCRDVSFTGCTVSCRTFFDVVPSDKYALSGFSFTDCTVTEEGSSFDGTLIEGTAVSGLVVNGERLE